MSILIACQALAAHGRRVGGDGRRSGSHLHQHGRRDARHASADAPQVRAAGTGAAVADDRQHAPVHAGGIAPPAHHQALRRRARDQSGRRAAPAARCRNRAPHAAADRRDGARHRQRPTPADERDAPPERHRGAVMEFKDYYATLGVTKASSEKEIKQAYRKLARKFHPDVNPGDKAAEARFKDINEAYEVLGDSAKRSKYDELGANWRQYEQAERAGGANPFAGWNPSGGGAPGGGV